MARNNNRRNTVVARKQGSQQYTIHTFTIPTHIVREAKLEDRLDKYEFEVEVTEQGILFKPVHLSRRYGW